MVRSIVSGGGRLIFVVAFVVAAGHAELQNIAVGGKLEIYGAWYSEFFEPSGGQIRIPDFFLPGRAIGPNGTASAIRTGESGHSLSFFEQRTRLYVDADFTNHVRGFIELDSIDTWGEDFRSDYRTGADSRVFSGDDVELYQAYIDVDQMFGRPLHLRIGRQELEFGSGWLVGADPGPDPFVGLSFDGVRMDYMLGNVLVTGWWSKVAERGIQEQDGDTDFMGVYLTLTESGGIARSAPFQAHETVFPIHVLYHTMRHGPMRGRVEAPSEEVRFDLYWMLLRDAASRNDTNFIAPLEWLEDVVGLDNYDATTLHTVGARGAGTIGGLDWELEAAYQWGEADAMGALFRPNGQIYGDDRASWNAWGGHAEIGYTLDGELQIRPHLGAAYYGGEDNRDLSFLEWINPFYRSEASVSFNRLFSSWREDAFIDGSAMTNFWKAYAGVSMTPTAALEAGGSILYLEALEPFDRPKSVGAGNWRIPLAPALAFWTEQGSRELGWQTNLWLVYNYTENLSFEVGWSHFFTGEGVKDGAFIDENGLTLIGGQDDADADYLYFLTTLEF
ncbi:MAG: alginate export family protein [Candidatus Hydrogenedentes bacterium]|nr:alginate export family protein [Candidatus Hydrogenedentota bacterium]